jgi:hypothetical protein
MTRREYLLNEQIVREQAYRRLREVSPDDWRVTTRRRPRRRTDPNYDTLQERDMDRE